jgi:hypothetical protein
VIAGGHNLGGLTVKGTHKLVKNIQAKRAYGFQSIRVDVKLCGVIWSNM